MLNAQCFYPYSNTTLVKVKLYILKVGLLYHTYSNTTLVKVKLYIIAYWIACKPIQIQHLLKLNGVGRSLGGENNNSNTTLVKVKLKRHPCITHYIANSNTTLVKVKFYHWYCFWLIVKFKYNTC